MTRSPVTGLTPWFASVAAAVATPPDEARSEQVLK